MSVSSSEPIACVYVIVSHTDPAGVVRLARTIVEQSPAAQVLIHHDALAGTFPADALAGIPRVTLVKDPVRVHWGTFSQVEAVLRSMHQARGMNLGLDWLTVISGQDYPARPIAAFESMLAGSGADAFMTYDRITAADRHLNDRYGFHYRRMLAGPLPRFLRARDLYDRVFNCAQPFLRIQTGLRGTFTGLRARPSVLDLPVPIFKGWSWITLRRNALDAVFDWLDGRPEFIRCYAGTLCPDESFFQTIVVNSPGLVVCNASLHYADWRPRQSGPTFLGLDDLPAIRASQQWFARKIDTANDSGLRDALDAFVRNASVESTR
jgi:hypothetical protein